MTLRGSSPPRSRTSPAGGQIPPLAAGRCSCPSDPAHRHRNPQYGCAMRAVLIVAIGMIAALPANVQAYTSSLTPQEATAVLRSAIRAQAPRARDVRTSCREARVANTAVCNAFWVAAHRFWSGRVTIRRHDTASTEVIAYTLSASGISAHHRPKKTRKRGTVRIAIPPGATRTNPILLGTSAAVADWRVAVLSVTPDATAEVLAENQFNDPPAPGRQFYIARVRATYTGNDSASFDGGYRLRAVGSSSVEYTSFGDSCGVIPDELSDNQVFTNGMIEGNVCWAVRSTDASTLVMYDIGPFLSSASPVYFALRP
jgi:hypothetical protein